MNPLLAKIHAAKWLIVGLAFAAVLAFAGLQTLRLAYVNMDLARVVAERAIEDKQRAEIRARQVAETAARERALMEAGAAQGRTDAEKIATLARDNVRLERLLRDRPRRPGPAGLPAPAAPSGGGGAGAGGDGTRGTTGAQLYAEDGAFLAGEAARAKRQRIQLSSCLRQYQDAREKLNGGGQ